MCGVALSAPGDAREAFLLGGLSWIVPGALLGASGVAVLARWPSARRLCLLSVVVAVAGVGVFTAWRDRVPPGVADAGEWALAHPDLPDWAMKVVTEAARGDPRGTMRMLRDPGVARDIAWVYSAYCCCPVLPWYLLVLVAALPRGRLRPTPPEAPR
jgi:hypothetical protein